MFKIMNNSNQTGSTVANLRLTSTIPKLEEKLKKLGFDRKHHRGFEYTQSEDIIDFLKNKIDEFDKKFKEDAEKPENKGKPYQNPTAIYPRGDDEDKEYIGKLLENALKKQKKPFAVVNASALDIAMTSSSKAITKVFSPAPLAQPQQKQYTPAKIISFLERFAYKAQTLLSTIGSGISNIPTKISQGITSFATETINTLKTPTRSFIKGEKVSNPFNFIDENGNPHPDQSNTPPPSAMQKIEDRINAENARAKLDSAKFRSELDPQSKSRTSSPFSFEEIYRQKSIDSRAYHLGKLQEAALNSYYPTGSSVGNPNSPSQPWQSQLSQALNGVDSIEYPDLYKQLSQMATQGNPPSRTSPSDSSSTQNPAGANLSLLALSRQASLSSASDNPPGVLPQEKKPSSRGSSAGSSYNPYPLTTPEMQAQMANLLADQRRLDLLGKRVSSYSGSNQNDSSRTSTNPKAKSDGNPQIGANPSMSEFDLLSGGRRVPYSSLPTSSSGNPQPLATARQSTLQPATLEQKALLDSLKRSGPSEEIGVNSVAQQYNIFRKELAKAEAKDPPPSSSPATARTDHLTHIKRQGGTLSTFVYR